jgi:hypothetical protein
MASIAEHAAVATARRGREGPKKESIDFHQTTVAPVALVPTPIHNTIVRSLQHNACRDPGTATVHDP